MWEKIKIRELPDEMEGKVMSNHWVGYAMAEISDEVCKLLDHGELSFNHARKLIDLMQKVGSP